MKFEVNDCKKVERETKKGQKYTAYQLNLVARRTVKAGGLTQVKATSVFFMNNEELKKGTTVEVPLDRCNIRESVSEDGSRFTWLTINGLDEANSAVPATAAAKQGATV